MIVVLAKHVAQAQTPDDAHAVLEAVARATTTARSAAALAPRVATRYYDESMRPIEAHYENGLLRPSAPLALRPGERVALVVLRLPDPSRWDMSRLAGHADEDAALAAAGLDEWADALDRGCQGSAALIHRSSAELIHLEAGSRIGVRPLRESGRRRLPPVRQN